MSKRRPFIKTMGLMKNLPGNGAVNVKRISIFRIDWINYESFIQWSLIRMEMAKWNI